MPGRISVILLSLILITCSGSDKTLRNIPREERKGLLILNFQNNTPKSRAAEFLPWEYGLASMMITDIEEIGIFNIIGKERLKDVLQQQEFQLSGLVNPDSAAKIGNLTGARYILTGSFMEMSGTLRIEAQVFSVEKGTVAGTAAVSGSTDQFFDLQKSLLLKTTVFLDALLNEEEQKKLARNIETRSVEASLNNYRGEIALSKAEDLKAKGKSDEARKIIVEAKENFERAVKIDPAYEKAKENLSRISLAIPVTL